MDRIIFVIMVIILQSFGQLPLILKEAFSFMFYITFWSIPSFSIKGGNGGLLFFLLLVLKEVLRRRDGLLKNNT
jgi:hypothetical protein